MNGIARLIDDPEMRFSAAGKAVVKVRLAFNSRRRDPATNEWVDSDSFFIDGKAFDQAAQNIADSLGKGMEVVVSGRLKTEKWETRDGEKRSAPALLIDSIGPSLRYATASVQKAQGGSGTGKQDAYAAASRQSSQEGRQDPWGADVPGTAGSGAWSEEPPF
jgi:single-strand DNA-binding protein